MSPSIAVTAGSLTDSLPPLEGFTYIPWSEAENDAFLAGPFGGDNAFVQEFAGSDVEQDGRLIAWIELNLLLPQFRRTPDAIVLDQVSTIEYYPGPQTTERLTLAGEQVLVRRIPSLVAWTWHEGGIVVNVVANGVDPGAAGGFVAALSAAQQSASVTVPTSAP